MTTVSIKKTLFNYIWIISCLILLFIVACAGWFATGYLGDKARREILEYNESRISLHSSHLTAEFEKIEKAVKLLSGSPGIAPAIISRKETDIANANSALDRYNSSLGSSVSYLLNSNGKTIASSNRNDSDSFVGKSYQFRPYFTLAIKGSPGRYFALGATSLKRGFYASYPVKDGKGQIIGVVVIKQDVDEHEAHLVNYPYCFVVDPNGIIFLSGKKEMNFKSLWPVSRETQLSLFKSKQFGEREFDSVMSREVADGMEITFYGRNYLASRKVINPEGWSIVLMTTTKRVLIYRLAGVFITILICIFITVPFVIGYKTSRSAEMVRESEMRYRQLFERNLAGVYRTSIDGRLLDCNNAFVRIYGYESREEILQRSAVDFHVSPEARQQFISSLQAGGMLLDFESQGRRKDGSLVWLLENAVLVPGEEGGLTEIEGTLVDITGRKRAEETVMQERDLTQATIDSLPGLFYLFDDQGRFLRWNKNLEEVSGYSAREIARMSPLDFFSGPDKKTVEDAIQKVFLTGQSSVEADFLSRDQTRTPYFFTGKTFLFEKKLSLIGMGLDITERKCAEEAQRESERQNRELYENLRDGSAEVDVQGRIIRCNNRFLNMLGYTFEELSRLTYEDITPFRWHAPEIETLQKQVNVRGYSDLYEKEYIKKDGTIFPVEIQTYLVKDNKGSIAGYWAFVRDITERKMAEADKVKLEEQYRQAQKMEAIGQLAGGVAHDFNNMLNIILGYSQMALMKIEPSWPLYKDINEIMNASRRSANLVRQLLAFARKQTIAPKSLDLNNTVAGMLNMLRKLIGEDIDLLWMPAANMWPVKMDPAQVDQILANLVVNARDSISGVGKITIETGKAEFDEAYCAQHNYFIPGYYAMLAVSDNGCGMGKDTLEKIFEPFFTTKEIGKGTGMGLATVYGIIKQNNGFINVHSEQGKGTTFKIYLPRFEEEGAIDKSSALAKPLTGTEIVLLVEDEEALLKMGKMMLEELGYTVIAAGSPNEAIKLVKQYAGDIHLVVTDVIMPEMSGRDLQKRLNALRPDMKYLFMSGHTADVIAHQGILDEGVNFLQKPFSMNDLAAKVREVMEKA